MNLVLMLGLIVASGTLALAALGLGSARKTDLGPPPLRSSEAVGGIWISHEELKRLPMQGAAWRNLRETADAPLGDAELADQSSRHDTDTLAVALVYARTGEMSYRRKAAAAIMAALETENGGQTLALARNLVSYVIAADLIQLGGFRPGKDRQFRRWLAGVRTEVLDNGESLVDTHRRPNNWGTHAGASLAAAAAYLYDSLALAEVARVFKGWTGDKIVFSFARWPSDSDSWVGEPDALVPVNPTGAVVDGHSVDGALPAEQSRCDPFEWPPCHTRYPWGALGGALVQAMILHRQGYDAFEWGDQALRRATEFLHGLSEDDPFWWEEARSGNDSWQPWLVNFAYGTGFPTVTPTKPGMPMGWTDWTHARRAASTSSTSG